VVRSAIGWFSYKKKGSSKKASRHRGIEASRHRAEERQREEEEEEEKSYPQITQIRADYLRGERQRVRGRVRGRGRGRGRRRGRGRKELSTDYAD